MPSIKRECIIEALIEKGKSREEAESIVNMLYGDD